MNEIESAITGLSLEEKQAVRDWLDDLIEDQLEVSDEFKAKIQRAKQELADGVYSRTSHMNAFLLRLGKPVLTSLPGLSALLGWLMIVMPVRAAESTEGRDGVVRVMTFNLRYASSRPPNAWQDRRPVMKACIEQTAPDLIGTQEGLYQQLKDLASDLPAYEWLGLGREGGSRGEFMAIFYRKSRFEALEYDHFWLSDTPNVIASTTWGNSNRRMVTWIKFLDRQTQRQFYFFNTHLDHQIQPAREKGAALIRERVDALKTKLPVLLVGDFNAEAGANKAYDILVGADRFADTWTSAREHRGDIVNSFHGFNGPTAGTNRIDWILARGAVTTDAVQIVTFASNGQYPSDHFPVVAWVRLGENP